MSSSFSSELKWQASLSYHTHEPLSSCPLSVTMHLPLLSSSLSGKIVIIIVTRFAMTIIIASSELHFLSRPPKLSLFCGFQRCHKDQCGKMALFGLKHFGRQSGEGPAHPWRPFFCPQIVQITKWGQMILAAFISTRSLGAPTGPDF